MINPYDVAFMADALDEVSEDSGESITLYTVSSSVGTLGSLEPATITYSQDSISALSIGEVTAKDIESSGGRYKASDVAVETTSSFSKDSLIGWRGGTYESIDGPMTVYFGGQSMKHRAVLRRAR